MHNKATASPPSLPVSLAVEARGSFCHEHETWGCTKRHEAKGGKR